MHMNDVVATKKKRSFQSSQNAYQIAYKYSLNACDIVLLQILVDFLPSAGDCFVSVAIILL